MTWTSLIGLGLVLWGACGAVMSIGRRLWSLDTTLRVHLVAAPAAAFVVSAIHTRIDPAFGMVSRAAVLTALVFTLDLLVVAPLFERSYAMFRSLIGTWMPFALIFAASLAAGVLISP
jgi:Na+-transporting NADH:ubiquinone oxidoreductase subunit NqrD